MKKVIIIPARYGSTRFGGKPLMKINGKPVIQHVYERCTTCMDIDEICVATDDKRILDFCTSIGAKALLTSESHKSGTDRAYEAAVNLGLAEDDIVINVQGDQPLVNPKSVEDVLKPFSKKTSMMTTLAYKIKDKREITDPKDVKVIFSKTGKALYFSRAQIPFPRDKETDFYFKHLGIYAYKMSFLKEFTSLPKSDLEEIEKLEQLRVLEYGYNIDIYVTDYDSPEVDLESDIARIEKLLKSKTNGN